MKVLDVAAAALELDEALSYFNDIHPGLADTFFQEVARAKRLISQFPFAWKNLDKKLKGFVMHHYPYTIVYQIRGEIIWVVAYAHHKRRLAYWKNRLQDIH